MMRAGGAWRALTVFVTAYVLVLQLLLVGFTGGAQAAAWGESHGGGLICSGLADSGAPSEGQTPPHDGADCCTLGCPMSGTASAVPPEAGGGFMLRHAGLVSLPLPHAGLPPAALRLAANAARAPPVHA